MSLLADLVVLFHLLWIFFLIFGAILAVRRPWLKGLHIAALAYSVALQVFHWTCPLTYVEIWLRGQTGSYEGGFLAHYAERLIYLPLRRELVLTATIVIVALSLVLYFRTWKEAR
jgi:hypothetical protein